MNDHHVLITQLCDELDHNRRCLLDDRRVTHPLAGRARAVLAADGPAVPEGREPASVAPEATEQAQPLWKVMRTAYDCSTAPNGSTGDWIEQDGFAAEIRAVAEWLVPEEEPLPDSVHGGNRFARQAERQRLRALLATEADRAERGDG